MLTLSVGGHVWHVRYLGIEHVRPWIAGRADGRGPTVRSESLSRTLMVLAEDIISTAGMRLIEAENQTE